MAAILFIEDDKKVEELMKMILPSGEFRILKSSFPQKDDGKEKQGPAAKPSATLEEVMKLFLREELNSERQGNIHGSIIHKLEKTLIETVLEEEKGNQVRAAKRLGMNRNTMRKKIKDFNIETRVVAISPIKL